MAIFPFSNVGTFLSHYQMYVLLRSIYGFSKLQKSWENGSWNLKTAGNISLSIHIFPKLRVPDLSWKLSNSFIFRNSLRWIINLVRGMQENAGEIKERTLGNCKTVNKTVYLSSHTPKGTFFNNKKCISQ